MVHAGTSVGQQVNTGEENHFFLNLFVECYNEKFIWYEMRPSVFSVEVIFLFVCELLSNTLPICFLLACQFETQGGFYEKPFPILNLKTSTSLQVNF